MESKEQKRTEDLCRAGGCLLVFRPEWKPPALNIVLACGEVAAAGVQGHHYELQILLPRSLDEYQTKFRDEHNEITKT